MATAGLPLGRLSSVRAPQAAAWNTGADDDGLSAFFRVRPRLFGIAYRMLRNVAEAEDVVQDVWVRWHTTDRSVVRDAPAFLATITTRLAMNVIGSARSRRETQAEGWVREPVDASADAASGAERGDALRSALLALQESLPAAERAAYVLREAFDYPYREIADVLGVQEANARQLATRARQRIAIGRRVPGSPCDPGRLLDAFRAASQSGDLAGLEVLLASDTASRQGRRGGSRVPPGPQRPS